MNAPIPVHPDHVLHWAPTDATSGAAAPDPLRLNLMPERAVFEPLSRTLFVADVHLGKAAVFRARGLPVPRGTTAGTLDRLSQALDRSQATHLVVLGDFLHARESHARGTLAALAAWRQRHAALNCSIVEGNHDAHAGPLNLALDFPVRTEPYAQGLLRGVHHPPEDGEISEANILTLVGHVHPVVHLRGRTDRLRLAAFWLRRHVLTLPAFGDFTGGFAIRPGGEPDERLFVVGDRVLPLHIEI